MNGITNVPVNFATKLTVSPIRGLRVALQWGGFETDPSLTNI